MREAGSGRAPRGSRAVGMEEEVEQARVTNKLDHRRVGREETERDTEQMYKETEMRKEQQKLQRKTPKGER